MAQRSRLAKAADTRKNNNLTIGKTPYSVALHEKEFISPEKTEVLDLPYNYIVWIGAKYSGKTRPVLTRMLGMILEDNDTYGLALKKYKTNAAERLHTAISNMSIELRQKGYGVPLMKKGISKTVKLVNMKVAEANQTIEYSALDDSDAIAGIEAPNLGKFGIVHIEEPVERNDRGELPSASEF